nr:MAG TPA: hypothetical protein [Caudoviricetes sp.]
MVKNFATLYSDVYRTTIIIAGNPQRLEYLILTPKNKVAKAEINSMYGSWRKPKS